jgi:hypothetical protein
MSGKQPQKYKVAHWGFQHLFHQTTQTDREVQALRRVILQISVLRSVFY